MKVKIAGKKVPKVIDINRRKAIREKCLNCSGFSPKEVRDCDHVNCGLYEFRLGRGKQNAKARDKAIREYCMWCTCDQRTEVRLCMAKDCPLYAYRMTTTDRSIEIHVSSEKRHIRHSSEKKKETEYLSIS
ncbi:MAG: hypothetical protein HF978_01615 [Desulfobacteraceae bacterium]|nr:hypothetical protein [Desulfobacteraceae bacterium]MBC2754222.1 hypothetical protein [Desulfobacteraceae bacterium]